MHENIFHDCDSSTPCIISCLIISIVPCAFFAAACCWALSTSECREEEVRVCTCVCVCERERESVVMCVRV